MSEVNIEQITKEEIKVIVRILYDCVNIHSNFLLLFMKPKTIVTYILNDNSLNVTIKENCYRGAIMIENALKDAFGLTCHLDKIKPKGFPLYMSSGRLF